MWNLDDIERNIDVLESKLFSIMELTGQPYESFMNMPYSFFERFLKWKTDMVKEQNERNKVELKAQQDMQRKIKAEQRMNMNKSRLRQEYTHPASSYINKGTKK